MTVAVPIQPVVVAALANAPNVCPKDTIKGLVEGVLNPLAMKAFLSSQHLKRFRDAHQRGVAAGFGDGVPTTDTAIDYRPKRWERFGLIRLDDIKGPTRISVDRAAKDRLIFALTRGSDVEEQCPRVLWKKKASAGGNKTTGCDDWTEVSPRQFCRFGDFGDELGPDGRKVPEGMECRKHCNLFKGYGYSPVFDLVANKDALQGVLFGSACTTGRGRSALSDMNERNDVLRNMPAFDANYLGSGDKVETMFRNYPLLDAVLRKRQFVTPYRCAVELRDMEYAIRNELKGMSTVERLLDDARRAACKVEDAAHGACRSVSDALGSARNTAAKWVKDAESALNTVCKVLHWVPISDDLERQCNNLRAAVAEKRRQGEELIAKAQEALQKCIAAQIPVADCRNLKPKTDIPTLQKAWTLYNEGIGTACSCPKWRRVNFFVEDYVEGGRAMTNIQFHAGWFSIDDPDEIAEPFTGIRLALAAGVKGATLTVTPQMSEDRFSSMYVPKNDLQRHGDDPFKPGGLFHIEDQCIAPLLKPRLDWLYACSETPAAGLDVSRWSEPTLNAERDKAMRANCAVESRKPDVDCLCMQGLLMGATFDRKTKKVVLDGKFLPEDIPGKGWGHNWKRTHACGDQIRRAMILSREVRYNAWEANPLEKTTLGMCRPNAVLEDEEDFFDYMVEKGWKPDAACNGAIRAAIYRGDVVKCAPNCKGNSKEEYNDIPAAVPRVVIALENLRRRGHLKVIPGDDPGFLALRLKIENKGGIGARLYARFVETGKLNLLRTLPLPESVKRYGELDRILNKEWLPPQDPPALTGGFDVVVTPYASKHGMKPGDAFGPGTDFAVGVEFASDDHTYAFKGDVADWLCKRFTLTSTGIVRTVCRELVQKLVVETKVKEVLERTLPQQIQWMMSASLQGIFKPDLTSFVDWAITKGVGAAAEELKKLVAADRDLNKLELGDLLDPDGAKAWVERFLNSLPKEK